MTTDLRATLRERGHDRVVVARAPGRVNVIGEHTDYNGGYVLPMAIQLGVTAAVAPRADGALVMRSAQVPDAVVSVDLADLAPGACSGWSAYVAGAIWAVRASLAPSTQLSGLDVIIDGDVPLGAGLSSSAAVECAVATAIAALCGLDRSPRELARVAQRAENEFVGVPTGSMDQVASMLGQEGAALFYDVREDRIEPVPLHLDQHGLAFLVIDTRVAHALVDGGYAARRASCEQAAWILGIDQLRDVADLDHALTALRHAVPGADGDELARRTRHVVTENERVLQALEALRGEDLPGFGRLMDASHASLRDDYQVSCPELDLAVTAAREAGALGARMTGGGFGGSALALVPASRVDEVTAAVVRAFASAGFGAPRSVTAVPSAGARLIPDRIPVIG